MMYETRMWLPHSILTSARAWAMVAHDEFQNQSLRIIGTCRSFLRSFLVSFLLCKSLAIEAGLHENAQ